MIARPTLPCSFVERESKEEETNRGVRRHVTRKVSRTHSSPNEHSERNLHQLALFPVLDDNTLFFDLLDHCSSKDVDLVLFKGRLGVLNELLFCVFEREVESMKICERDD